MKLNGCPEFDRFLQEAGFSAPPSLPDPPITWRATVISGSAGIEPVAVRLEDGSEFATAPSGFPIDWECLEGDVVVVERIGEVVQSVPWMASVEMTDVGTRRFFVANADGSQRLLAETKLSATPWIA